MRLILSILFFCIFFTHKSFANTNAVKKNTITILIDHGKSYQDKQHYSSAQHIIISAQQIRQSNVQNVIELLQSLAFLHLTSLTGNVQQLSIGIRGFGGNAALNSLILLNGVPLSNSDLSNPELSLIAIQDIERVEISLGSEGVLYGNQAVGGVINFITKTGTRSSQGIQLTAGNFATLTSYGYLSKKIGNLEWYQSAQYLQSHQFRQHNRIQQAQLFGNLRYLYDSGDIQLDYALMQNNMLFAGALNQTQVLIDRTQAQNDRDFTNGNELFFHFKNHQHLNSHWQIQTDISERSDQHHLLLTSPFTQAHQQFRFEPLLAGDFQHESILAGTQFMLENYHLDASAFHLQTESQQKDYFIMSKTHLSEAIQFILGFRFANLETNIHSTSGDNFNHSVEVSTQGIEAKLNPHLSWFIRRDGNFRFPKTDEMTFTPQGKLGLNTQTGISYETGFNYDILALIGKINLYQLDLDNEIAFDPHRTPVQPFGANRNLDPTRRRGLILENAYYLNRKITITNSLNLTHPTFRTGELKGKHIPFVPEVADSVSLNYQFTPCWNAITQIVYTGKRFPIYDDFNQFPQEPHILLLNIAINYHLKHLFIEGRINNITNHTYNSYVGVDLNSQSQFYYPAPGRQYWLSLGWQN